METRESQDVLKLIDLGLELSENILFSHLDLSIKKGEVFGIIGFGGSGKSTLIEVMCGARMLDHGRVQVLDEKTNQFISVFGSPRLAKSIFGVSYQNDSFYNHLSVEENLDYFGTLYGISKKSLDKNIVTAMELVEISKEKDMFGGVLSAGSKRKLDFACALVHNPKVLILDSPTSNLDFMSKKQIWKLIRRINQTGKTIILSSPSLEEVELVCDRIAVLHQGKMIFVGSVSDLRKHYTSQEAVHLVTADKDYKKIISLLKKIKNISISDIIVDKDRLIVYSRDATLLVHFFIHATKKLGKKIIELDLNKPMLEEIVTSICKG